jgi:hypothetical protein
MRMSNCSRISACGDPGVCVVRGPERGAEDLGLVCGACPEIHDLDLLARIIDEHHFADGVVLTHDRRQPPLELA